jgi:hypothetical protein
MTLFGTDSGFLQGFSYDVALAMLLLVFWLGPMTTLSYRLKREVFGGLAYRVTAGHSMAAVGCAAVTMAAGVPLLSYLATFVTAVQHWLPGAPFQMLLIPELQALRDSLFLAMHIGELKGWPPFAWCAFAGATHLVVVLSWKLLDGPRNRAEGRNALRLLAARNTDTGNPGTAKKPSARTTVKYH